MRWQLKAKEAVVGPQVAVEVKGKETWVGPQVAAQSFKLDSPQVQGWPSLDWRKDKFGGSSKC